MALVAWRPDKRANVAVPGSDRNMSKRNLAAVDTDVSPLAVTQLLVMAVCTPSSLARRGGAERRHACRATRCTALPRHLAGALMHPRRVVFRFAEGTLLVTESSSTVAVMSPRRDRPQQPQRLSDVARGRGRVRGAFRLASVTTAAWCCHCWRPRDW